MIVNVSVNYEPTPEQVAEEFCDLYQDGQARFLNRVAEIFNRKNNSLPMQLEYITQEKSLTNDARYLMVLFGDYANQNLNNKESDNVSI